MARPGPPDRAARPVHLARQVHRAPGANQVRPGLAVRSAHAVSQALKARSACRAQLDRLGRHRVPPIPSDQPAGLSWLTSLNCQGRLASKQRASRPLPGPTSTFGACARPRGADQHAPPVARALQWPKPLACRRDAVGSLHPLERAWPREQRGPEDAGWKAAASGKRSLYNHAEFIP